MSHTDLDKADQKIVFVNAVKILLLLITACSVHRSLSPPNPSVKSDECCSGTEGTDTLFERVVQSITYCSKSMVWIGVILDVICIIARLMLLSAISNGLQGDWGEYVPDGFVSLEKGYIPTAMVVGTVLAALSAGLRTWCFNSLGPFFTFEITIRPKHRLIMHGPYAWVRHPSYTGVYLTLTGATLVLAAPGSFLSEYALKTPLGSLVALFWGIKCAFAFRGMVVRLKAEDDVLRDTFGVQWEDYAARVPNKFLPGLL